LNVKRLSLAVIAIARLTFANMAADSGVLLKIVLATLSFGISYFSWVGLSKRFGARIRRWDSVNVATKGRG
jgi:hypothetical protein